jgi:hypothetical protein
VEWRRTKTKKWEEFYGNGTDLMMIIIVVTTTTIIIYSGLALT